ncbi:unnamed protein product [Mytilus coruscus]|uniref:ZP domain-containing protein n=1 Tax=Mytilus coruscus TaxID=42192 RepID=A0A6J7ZXP2_MYTCO|nr:unnamed protein product [Mytilus coruscus]
MQSTNFNESRWMQVAVYDNNENEAYISPTTTRIPYLVTGHHVFNLTCLPLKEAGVDRIALAETGITDTEQLHNVYNEIGQVEMRFKEDESIDKPDVSTVYIGDRFYMYLKYMGDTKDYVIVPQTCTAYQGTFRSDYAQFMDLWTQNGTKRNDCTTEDARKYKVMTNFRRLSSIIVHAELHGFRFNANGNSGFDDVTISCTVKICTSATGNCTDNCQIMQSRTKRETDTITSIRQKRSTGRIRSQTVSQTIRVGQTEFKSNDGGNVQTLKADVFK